MSVKIFLPSELFYTKENCDIYGEIQINESNDISYFVISNVEGNSPVPAKAQQRLRHLGHIAHAGPASSELHCSDVAISFAYDSDTPNIYLYRSVSIKPPQTPNVNVFLYKPADLVQLQISPEDLNGCSKTGAGDSDSFTASNDISVLFQLLQQHEKVSASDSDSSSPARIFYETLHLPLLLLTRAFTAFLECRPVVVVLRQTVLYEHFQEWKRLRGTGKRNANIVIDRILGLCVMVLLLFYIVQAGEYLLQASHFVIREFRLLLHSLKGTPIGLKLNSHLNNFLLDCFNYHIDLWATFLDLIDPLVRYLFLPMAFMGCLGLSFQLALFADLISVVGLHAHCFYIYTAVLYKVEIKGIQVLWKVVLGKRYNVLKKRVESHNYMNRQLYLATIFFTSLLFLFPTVIVYYIVFTALRLVTYLISSILQLMRRCILKFPLRNFCKYLQGRFFEMESLHLQHVLHAPSPLLQPETTQMGMFVFKLNVQSSSLGRVFSCERGILQEVTAHEQSIFNRILAGTF